MYKFVKGIITFSLKNRLLVMILTVLMAIMGVYSYNQTPIVAFPDFTNTEIRIITQWQGHSAEEIERFVTIPIEIVMNSVQRKVNLRSRTMFGLSVISIVFEDGVDDTYARQQVLALLPELDLPAGVTPQLTPPTGPVDEIFRYTVKSENNTYSNAELRTIEDWVIERNLRTVPGVADVNAFGGQVRTFEVSTNPLLLEKYGLTALDVYDAIQNSNVNVGGNVIERASQNFVVRGIGLLENISEIENVLIKNVNGTPILVRNVADVRESSLPRLGQVGRNYKDDVVEGIVLQRKGLDPLPVVRALKEKIQDLNDNILPSGVKIVPFYNIQTLINYCLHTVLHNISIGMLLVIVIVFAFMFDLRSTLILSLTVPLSILFAFICLYLKGMFANLISIGALDFGILINGTVVIVEGLFVVFVNQAKSVGMDRFNRMLKLGLIKKTVNSVAAEIFFAQLIIIIALFPVFTFQKVEGKIFSPLAYMLGFALLGSLVITFMFVPAFSSWLFRKNMIERNNPIMNWVWRNYERVYDWVMKNKKLTLGILMGIVLISFASTKFLGSEFLPELDEGALWIRGVGPLSLSLTESKNLADSLRKDILKYREVSQCISQTGRPDDGTDIKNFNNIEILVELYPQDSWKSGITREELIEKMSHNLTNKYTGILWTFSQPILDNVNEAVAGLPVNNGVKIYGPDLDTITFYINKVEDVVRNVRGMTDTGILQIMGQPELIIDLNQEKMGLYGVRTANANAIIEMAIGGKAASQLYENEKHFDIMVRYQPEFRKTENEIANLMVPTSTGGRVPLKEISTITDRTGASMIYRDNNERYGIVQFSTMGRDLGSTVKDMLKKINESIKLPKGYHMELAGEYSSEVRAMKRLAVVVPISLVLIVLVLLGAFRNIIDVLLIMINIPFALVGGIFSLLMTGIPFNISAGIGFVALFGVCIQNGVILISVFRQNLRSGMEIDKAIKEGALSRVRSVVMTSLIAIFGLLPAAMSNGIGAQTQRPFAIVIVGGLVTSMILVLIVLPLIFRITYSQKNFKNGSLAPAEF